MFITIKKNKDISAHWCLYYNNKKIKIYPHIDVYVTIKKKIYPHIDVYITIKKIKIYPHIDVYITIKK